MEDVVVRETVTTSQRGHVQKTRVKTKTKKKRDFTLYLFDWIVKGALVAMLLSSEFVLFADSANNNLLSAPMVVTPYALCVIVGIIIFSFLTMFLLSFSSMLQNLFVAIATGAFVIMFFSHFALFDYSSFLYGFADTILGSATAVKFIGSSHYIFAAFIALILFVFMSFSRESTIAYFIGVVLLVFGSIIFNKYMNFQDKPEYQVVFENVNGEEKEKPRKFVYIAVPNLASYNFLDNIKDPAQANDKLDRLMDSMLAFYSKNGFMMYPNAYVVDDDEFVNMVRTLNMTTDEDMDKYFLYGINLSSYFSFSSKNDFNVFLKENKLFNIFKKTNYKISTYQSRGIDICRENNNIASDMCMVKNNLPINMKGLNLTTGQKAKLLFAQWIETSGLIKNYGKLYGLVDLVTDASTAPVVGLPYSKLYVVDSLATLDILADDIISDKTNRAYFAYIDLPADMYVYSEFCKPKMSGFWTSLKDLPWVNKNNLYKKRNAYFDQATCFYGKLEEFMQKLHAAEVADKSVIVIQGLSGVKELKSLNVTNYMDDFKNDKLVGMAIRDPLKKQFIVNTNVCMASDVLAGYLFKKDGECNELVGVPLQEGAKRDLSKYLKQVNISKKDVVDARNSFSKWHGEWARFNSTKLPEKPQEPEKKKDWVEQITDLELEEVEIKEAPKVVETTLEEEIEAETEALDTIDDAEVSFEGVDATSVEEEVEPEAEEDSDVVEDLPVEDTTPRSNIVIEDDMEIETIDGVGDEVDTDEGIVEDVNDDGVETEDVVKPSVDDILNDILSSVEDDIEDVEVDDTDAEKVLLLKSPESEAVVEGEFTVITADD